MFGPRLSIKNEKASIELGPYIKEYANIFAELGSSAVVRMFTGGPYGTTLEDEQDLYEQMRLNKTSVTWAIRPEAYDSPVGCVSLHRISYDGSCTSEIMLVNREYWGKGIGTLSHMVAVWYATDHLNRSIIRATCSEANIASIKSLENVGYFKTGRRLRTYFRNNKYYDDIDMAWINPSRSELLYPEGVPEEYTLHIEKATKILKDTREKVLML